jgi:hypothetical protein
VDMKTQHKLPAPTALDLPAVIDIYESQRPMMPDAAAGAGRQRHSLIDILDEFDGLILDGFGVINVGDGLVPGIEALLHRAAAQNIPVVVLTNGGSFESSQAAAKYAKWRLPIAADAVVSSRDALIGALGDTISSTVPSTMAATDVMGCLGAVVTPLAHAPTLAYGQTADFWQQADAFALLGAIDWTEGDQADFETALIARHGRYLLPTPMSRPRRLASSQPSLATGWHAPCRRQICRSIGMASPIARPLIWRYSVCISWLAWKLDTRRVAMVGDSLHT